MKHLKQQYCKYQCFVFIISESYCIVTFIFKLIFVIYFGIDTVLTFAHRKSNMFVER